MKYLHIPWVLIIVSLIACTTTREFVEQRPEDKTTAPFYTSAFPDVDISEKLTEIKQSVIRITSTGFYRSYLLEDPDITESNIQNTDFSEALGKFTQTEESTAGTAIVIAKNNQRALLLTCAHVVQFPDTVIEYRKGDNIPENTFVESVTTKIRQTNFALNLPTLSNFEILAADDTKDLALLEIDLRNNEGVDIEPLRLTMGNSKNLRLASIIYVLGYPKGYPMVTRGIVSAPDRTGNGDFIADALFNRGISGGLVISSKDHYNSFDWVGMSCSAAASNTFNLVPNKNLIDNNERLQPYSGEVFVEKKSNLIYGITHAVSTNKIISFLEENEDKMRGVRVRIDRSGFSN